MAAEATEAQVALGAQIQALEAEGKFDEAQQLRDESEPQGSPEPEPEPKAKAAKKAPPADPPPAG